jgi:hypothetical protein
MHMRENPWASRETEAAWDIVDAASAQSFPASDPPGWAIGQLYTEEQEEEALPDSERQDAPDGPSTSDPEPEPPAPRPRGKPR